MARHIARVAARLFAAQGYDATSVREIVEAAGVTKPTLYYHFGSKEGLAQALVTVPLTEPGRAAARDPGGPRRIRSSALVRMLEAHFAFCRDDPDRSRFVYALFFGPLGTGLAAELARFGAGARRPDVRGGRAGWPRPGSSRPTGSTTASRACRGHDRDLDDGLPVPRMPSSATEPGACASWATCSRLRRCPALRAGASCDDDVGDRRCSRSGLAAALGLLACGPPAWRHGRAGRQGRAPRPSRCR